MSDPTLTLTRAVQATTGLPEAQPRPGQLLLTRDIAEVLLTTEAGRLCGKAPTGVGKALAGLVPAAMLAAQQGGRVLLSTESLGLQSQMVEKDFPAVAKAVREETGRDLTIAVLKGWSNYACLSAARMAAQHLVDERTGTKRPEQKAAAKKKGAEPAHLPDTPQVREDLAMLGADSRDPLLDWVLGSTAGDGDKANYSGVLRKGQWEEVSITPDACPKDECPLWELCFARRARARAAAADLVVANHSLLAVQASKGVPVIHGNSTLGTFDAVVVDEAHSLPAAVRNAGSSTITARRLRSAVRAVGEFLDEDILPTKDPARAMLDRGRTAADLMEKEIGEGVRAAGGHNQGVPEGGDPLATSGDAARGWCTDAAVALSSEINRSDMRTAMAGRRVKSRVSNLASDIDQVRDTSPAVARWYSNDRVGLDVVPGVASSPVNVAGLLRDNLWSVPAELDEDEYAEAVREGRITPGNPAPSVPIPVVALSATLPASFPYDAGMPGIIRSYETPFTAAYADSMLYIPHAGEGRAPFPVFSDGAFNLKAHPAWAASVMDELIEANGGHALVLSATVEAGKMYADHLARAARGRWRVLSQWDGQGKDFLVSAWKRDSSSVLVGTKSLMTGVDAPGRTCSLVIMDRAPRAADNVVDNARAAVMVEGGMNSFVAKTTVYAGDAALLLEQGAGRLIRSINDRGVFALLEPRLRKSNAPGAVRPLNDYSRKLYRDALGSFASSSATLAQTCEYLHHQAAARVAA